MKTHFIDYPLSQGFVDRWLVLGPCTPVPTKSGKSGELLPPFHLPITPGAKFALAEGNNLFWQIESVPEDHRAERSLFVPFEIKLEFWAYCRLRSPKGGALQAGLTTLNPAQVWLNGEPLYGPAAAGTSAFDLPLRDGNNDLLVRLETEAYRETTFSLALRLTGESAEAVTVRLPVLSEHTGYWKSMENLFAGAHTDQAVFTGGDRIGVTFQEGSGQTRGGEINLRVQTVDGRVYGEFPKEVKPGDRVLTLPVQQLLSGDYEVMLMPPPQHYYENEFRVSRRLPFQVANERYFPAAQEAFDNRLVALMQEASRRGRLEGEIAKIAMGRWKMIDPHIIQAALGRVNRREAGSALDLLLLTGMLLRMSARSDFPQDLRGLIESVVMKAFTQPSGAGQTEGEALLTGAALALAAEHFTRRGMSVPWINAEPAAGEHRHRLIGWLHSRAQYGFAEFDSAYDEIITALVYLADLPIEGDGGSGDAGSKDAGSEDTGSEDTASEDTGSEDAGSEDDEETGGERYIESLPEMATVLLDKTLFTLAMHTWRGVMAVPQARANAAWLRSGQLNPAAAISYLLWGAGNLTGRMTGAVSLGLSADYRMPDLLASIALDTRDVWGRERCLTTRGEANLALFRTADFALSSLQDYRPGEPGAWEHAWQATLGPEALVFTNHPAALNPSDSRPAGFWAGSTCLPRIAQWQDALVCLYNLPEEAWLPWTHAYFPAAAFDEHRFEGGWAFARKGEGYLALFAAPGFEAVSTGLEAGRELRAPGRQAAWLCQLGRQSSDGSFEQFVRQVLDRAPVVEGLKVTWQTVSGSRLEFDWTGPLVVDGQEQPLAGFSHAENVFVLTGYPAQVMQIQYGDEAMILDFQ